MNDKFLFDGRLAVDLPDSFQAMENDRAELMYPYENRPQIILEDKDTARFCTFSLLKNQKLAGTQVEYVIHSIMEAVVSLYPSCLLHESDLVKREKGVCGWFSFRTAGTEGDLQNFMYIFPVDGCMMLGTMGCLIGDETGSKQLKQMMESLKNPERQPAYARSDGGLFHRTS